MKKTLASPASSASPDAPATPAHRDGQTTPEKDAGRAPKQPHERDESSESQQREPDPVMHQARSDVERGLADTSKGEATEETYARNLRAEPPDAATDAAAENNDAPRLPSDAPRVPSDKPPGKSR